MQNYKLFLALVVIILLSILFSFGYLSQHYEEIFGPEAEKFCEFNVLRIYEEELIDNKTCYRADFRLTVKEDMYSVEISPQDRSDSITKIISFDARMPASRTLKAGIVIYPTMSVQLDKNNVSGWVMMQISFIDIDAHEKTIDIRVEIEEVPEFPVGVTVIFGACMLIFFLMRRKYVRK